MSDQLVHWRLRAPTRHLEESSFELAPASLPDSLKPGEIRVRTRYISLDPYLSRFMQTWQGEVPGWSEGVVHGRVISDVLESACDTLAPGDCVFGIGRWQREQILNGAEVEKIAPEVDPPTLTFGVLGASGRSAWVGLHLAQPQAGDTVLVTAATGPVGSAAGQLAKIYGCRAIGIAGGAEKCAHAVETLGFDVCLDHREPDLAGRIAAAAPDGVNVLFENVGARMIDAALPSMVPSGRISLCGLAAHYNSDLPFHFENFAQFLYKQVRLIPFATAQHTDVFPQAQADLLEGVRNGTIHWDETIIDGLENAVSAYLTMLQGKGIGKRIIRV